MAESDLRQPTETVQREGTNKLKHLDFIKVATLYVIVYLVAIYEYAKENCGPLKSGVYSVESTVKTVTGPVYQKFHDAPFKLLKFLDDEIDIVIRDLSRLTPSPLKKMADEVMSVVQKAPEVAREVQQDGVVNMAKNLGNNLYMECEPKVKEIYEKCEPKVKEIYEKCEPKVKEIYEKCEPKVKEIYEKCEPKVKEIYEKCEPKVKEIYEKCEPKVKEIYVKCEPKVKEIYVKWEPKVVDFLVWIWQLLNQLPFFHQLAQIIAPTVGHWCEKYNDSVTYAWEKGYKGSHHLPLIPVEKIAKTFESGEKVSSSTGESCSVPNLHED